MRYSRNLLFGLAGSVLLALTATLAAADCNRNGRPDELDIAARWSQDCNENGIPDECDLATGFVPESELLFRCDRDPDGLLVDYGAGNARARFQGVTLSEDNPFGMPGNRSLLFDHTHDAINVEAGPETGLNRFDALTLSAYIKPTTLGGLHYIIWGDDDVYSLSIRDGLLRLSINQQLAASAGFDWENVWSHVAATYDGETARIYRDGRLLLSRPVRLGPVGPLGSRNLVRIGNDETADFGAYQRDFRGLIDQVRIVRRALTEEEIFADARQTYTPGGSRDCNHNRVPDECELALGLARDTNKNGVPDECEGVVPRADIGLRGLSRASLRPVRVLFADGRPRFVSARVPVAVAAGEHPVEQAYAYLEEHRDLYSLENPRAQLYPNRIASGDINGRSWHVFFSQAEGDIPVYAAELAVHISDSTVFASNGNYLRHIPPLPPATVTRSTAEAMTFEVMDLSGAEILGETRLFYFNGHLLGEEDLDTRLAWRVTVRGRSRVTGRRIMTEYLIDAHNAYLLAQVRQTPSGVPDKDFSIQTANNSTSDFCWWFPWEPDDDWFDEDGPLDDYPGGPGNFPGGDTDGDNAFGLVHQVYDFFHNNFGRHAWNDDDGGIEVMVHFDMPNAAPNAFYSPGCNHLRFTDGMVTPDIFAHEYTHAITEHTSDLIYQGQSGALNESYSDVFAALFDGNWTIGEGSNGGIGRNMRNPPSQTSTITDPLPIGTQTVNHPDHMSNFVNTIDDFGGVHINSGIPNKAAFLIIQGGTHRNLAVRGIGAEKAGHLYYFVLTRILTENSTFQEAAEATIAAADAFANFGPRPLHGFTPDDACQVINAFAAVGLTDPDLDCDGVRDPADPDDDGDWIPDSGDNCPRNSNPYQLDTDGDGAGDECDDDDDGDGILDDANASGIAGDSPCVGGDMAFCDDNCPKTPNPFQEDDDGDGIGEVCDDDDNDSVTNDRDNCRYNPNPNQADLDGDGRGDVCDPDDDGDLVPDGDDNCSRVANTDQTDRDGDGVGDLCDNCPDVPNGEQFDCDWDGVGNACESDDDGDGIVDDDDNCPCAHNPSQTDINGNGRGMACDLGDQHLVYGSSELEWLERIATRVERVTEPIRIPIGPCLEDCPIGEELESMTEIHIILPAGMMARVVDDRGFERAEAVESGDGYLLRFRSRPDSFLGRSDPRPLPLVGGPPAAPSRDADRVYRGRRYTLELYAAPDMQDGEQISFSMAVLANPVPEHPEVTEGFQIPGDCNQDSALDISDPICLLGYLFTGSVPRLPCGDGTKADPANRSLMDFNSDDFVDLSDGVALLKYLFAGASPHPLGRECTLIEGCKSSCDG